MFQMAQFASWMDGRYSEAVKAIALATCQCKLAMSVEYVTAATDGKGRLYARQASAQALPRDLRLLLYGATHKEVDMSGAHYELIRAMCASKSLPPVRALRRWLQEEWSERLSSVDAEEVQRAIKLFPLRVINGGAAPALATVDTMRLATPAWLAAFAYELEALRNAATSHILPALRPCLEVEFRNRHFYAAEAMEGIVMQLFLLEVRKRCFAPSIIWLHDGFWIGKEVDNGVLAAAERHVRSLLFPRSSSEEPLFRIIDLMVARDAVLQSRYCLPVGPLFPPSKHRGRLLGNGHRRLNRQFPVAKFTHTTGSKRKVSTYFHRVSKRARLFWLRGS